MISCTLPILWLLPMFFSSSPSAPSSWAIWYISHLNHPCAPPPAPGPDILNPKIFSRLPFLSPPPRLLHIPLPYPLLLFDDEIHLLESAVSSRELASATWQRGKKPQIRLKRPGVMISEGMWTAGGGPRLLSYQDEKSDYGCPLRRTVAVIYCKYHSVRVLGRNLWG